MSRFEEIVNEAIDEVVLGEAFKAETLASHIAERVRDRQDGHRAEVTIAARYPEHKLAPASGVPTQEIYTLFGSAVASRARHATARRRPGPGHDRLPVRAGDGHRALARAPARATASPTTRSRACSTRSPSPPTTSAASARSTSAARRAATRRSRPRTLLEIVEASMSSEIYELMKRPDEVEVVEKAHRRPRFVEDCVREMVRMATERFGGLGADAFVLGPPGEPRDDPQAQRGRRASRAAWASCCARSRRGERAARHVTMREWLEVAARPPRSNVHLAGARAAACRPAADGTRVSAAGAHPPLPGRRPGRRACRYSDAVRALGRGRGGALAARPAPARPGGRRAAGPRRRRVSADDRLGLGRGRSPAPRALGVEVLEEVDRPRGRLRRSSPRRDDRHARPAVRRPRTSTAACSTACSTCAARAARSSPSGSRRTPAPRRAKPADVSRAREASSSLRRKLRK